MCFIGGGAGSWIIKHWGAEAQALNLKSARELTDRFEAALADSREVMPGWSQDRKDDGPVVIERRG